MCFARVAMWDSGISPFICVFREGSQVGWWHRWWHWCIYNGCHVIIRKIIFFIVRLLSMVLGDFNMILNASQKTMIFWIETWCWGFKTFCMSMGSRNYTCMWEFSLGVMRERGLCLLALIAPLFLWTRIWRTKTLCFKHCLLQSQIMHNTPCFECCIHA
jgi:hypothetical protein